MRCSFIHLDGRAYFEKVAETPADCARLRHEAWILGLAAHAGVVTLAERPLGSGAPSASGDRAVVRTGAVRGRPLSAMDGLTTPEVAGLGAAVATTVADLHDAGITHGRLSADHILVDAAGRPVLCGFSAAAAAGPGAGRPGPAMTADVAALGHTLTALLAPLLALSEAVRAEPGADQQARAGASLDVAALGRLLEGDGTRRWRLRGEARRLARRLDDGAWAPRLPSRTGRRVPG